jgi:hypothetical protein
MTWRIFPPDFDQASVWAGVTGFVWYAFGAVPLQMAVSKQLELKATPFAFARITSAFWALVAGVLGSIVVDRRALADYLRAMASDTSQEE